MAIAWSCGGGGGGPDHAGSRDASTDAEGGSIDASAEGQATRDTASPLESGDESDAETQDATVPPPVGEAGTDAEAGADAGTDPTTAVGHERFETRASILGRVQTLAGAPVTGYTATVYDVPVGAAPRSDVTMAAATDGSFWIHLTSFPDSEAARSPPHHLMVFFDAPGYVRAKREVFAHPGMAVDLGTIVAVARDTNTVMIDASGGSVTDSKGLITLDIPAGALSAPTPITITPIQNRAEMPATLPAVTLSGYGFELEPTGTQFAVPATIHITNWRSFPTTAPIPIGYFDDVNGGWKHESMATWDGAAWTASIPHFSTQDCNPNAEGEWIVSRGKGPDPNSGDTKCVGSAVGMSGGTLVQDLSLPSYRHAGRDYGVTLNYNSGLAGSRTIGMPPAPGSAGTDGGASVSAALTVSQAVPSSGVTLSLRSSTFLTTCVSAASASAILASTPGTCAGGGCDLTGAMGADPWNVVTNLVGSQVQQVPSVPDGAQAFESGNWVELPAMPDGSVPASGFVPQQVQAGIAPSSGTTSASPESCSAGGTFGSPLLTGTPALLSTDSGPTVTQEQSVFVYHRHNSPFGPGWAIRELTRIYSDPQGDQVALVDGEGAEEDFRLRSTIQTVAPNLGGPVRYAFAVDATTGERMMADTAGNITRLNADGSTTSILSSVAFTGDPQSMAITYVAGERRFLIALSTGLVQVHASAAVDVLSTRAGNSPPAYLPSQVAARNDLALYTDGAVHNPLLYRVRLSTPPGALETISFSESTGGDVGLDPATSTTLSGYPFAGPTGVAYGPSGELYVSDTPRNAVYRVAPDASGEISGASAVARAVGDGAGRFIPELGLRAYGPQFPVNQPLALSTSPDGTLLVQSPYGIAAYDTQSLEGEWIALGGPGPNTDLNVGFGGSSVTALGPRSFLVAISQSGTYPSWVDASTLASERDPTRTLVLSTTGAVLTDTTRGLVETYDPQGRLTNRALRTGETLFTATYADAQSDNVTSIADADGNATTFTYGADGRVSSISDPVGGTTTLDHDGFGDLRSLTLPDGAVTTFVYDAHHMTSKTARGTDTTSYVYGSDGTLQSATKPAGETTTVQASLTQPAQYAGYTLSHAGTYTDARGVSHAFVTDAMGQITSDVYTADGVPYTQAALYYGNLDTVPNVPGEAAFQRTNTSLLRIDDTTLNGVPLGLSRTYDGLGRVTDLNAGTPHSGTNQVYETAYDPNGFVSLSYSGPADPAQAIVRDAAGHPIKIYDEYGTSPFDSRETDFTWRSDGQPATLTEHEVTTTYSYDDMTPSASHNVTGITDTMGRAWSLQYDARGNVGSTSDGVATQSFAYDEDNRLLVAADALGHQTQFGYTQVGCGCTEQDEVSSIHTPDLPAGNQWSLGYGPEGRLATITDPSGETESYAYEPTGELKSLVDRDGHTTTLSHDPLGRVLATVDALNRTHAFAYSLPSSGNWTGPTLLSGNSGAAAASTSFSAALHPGDYQIGHNLYGTRGYPAAISFYRDATFELPYREDADLGKRLTQRIDAAGQTAASITTPITITGTVYKKQFGYSAETSVPLLTSLTTDAATGYYSAVFDRNADLDINDTSGFGAGFNCSTISYTYARDTAGRLTGVTVGSSCGFPALGGQTYAYVPGSDYLQTYAGPDGTRAYVYDKRGLVTTMTATPPGGTAETWTFTYDDAGRSYDLTYPDGHIREQLYDGEGRITSRCYKYANANDCYTATYDGAGNPLTTSDPYGGSEAYTYDTLNRLTQVTRTVVGVTEHVESYAYNAIGGLHTTFDPVAMAPVTMDDQRPALSGSGTADAAIPKTYAGEPVTLDGGGRVTALSGATFTHRFDNLLGSIQAPSGAGTVTESFNYDSYNRRVETSTVQTSPATSTQQFYRYDGVNLVATTDASGKVEDAYLYDGIDHPLRLSRAAPCSGTDAGSTCSQSYFYEIDLAGNVRRLRDASGADLGGYRYTAFGVSFPADVRTPVATIDQPWRWKGRPFVNVAGGLYDMRARWWSPGMGAFLSIDQYAYHDARSTLWGWGGQNPIRWSDPTGHDVADWLISSGFYANSPTYINIAGGIALGAAAIATGGLALEAVGGSALAGGLGAGAPALAALADNEGPEISSAEMTVSDLIKSLNDLYSSQPDASAILTQFFKANLGGGDIVLTPGINSDLLEIYLQIALRAKDPLGVQAQRIDLIERTLGCGKP